MPARTHTPLPDRPSHGRGVIYARVSSKEQEKEGYSISAQLKLLREYAAVQGFAVAKEFMDVETAKQTGRTAFGEMVAFLKANPAAFSILVEKTDRLYRNLKDWVTIDELDVEVHLVKEGVVLSDNSLSSEKFMHGIRVLMAKNYIDNLSEEVRKGMLEKAEQGVWPTRAPLGYLNVTGSDGRKVIVRDSEVAPIITKLFEWYATGQYALKDVAKKARTAGLVYKKSGSPVPTSSVHTILRNQLYTGSFEWGDKLYQGKHEPLVSVELWEQVQDVMDGRNASKYRRVKHNFAFSRLITCGHCGCALVGEIKKKRYIYYHCTGYRGKCGEPYVREEVLEEEFGELLGQLRFDDDVLEWVRQALHSSHADERREHEEAILRLQAEYGRLDKRLSAMYIDKLDGKIDSSLYDKLAGQWREEQLRCLGNIEHHQGAQRSYMDEGVQLLELAQSAQRLFAKQDAREKRKLLDFLVSNCSWSNGELSVTLRKPFDLIAKTASINNRRRGAGEAFSSLSENWLGGQDSNLRPIG